MVNNTACDIAVLAFIRIRECKEEKEGKKREQSDKNEVYMATSQYQDTRDADNQDKRRAKKRSKGLDRNRK